MPFAIKWSGQWLGFEFDGHIACLRYRDAITMQSKWNMHIRVAGSTHWPCQLQRGAVMIRWTYSKLLTMDTPQLALEGKIWGVCCVSKIWHTLCHCYRSAVCNIVIKWTALKRHLAVLIKLLFPVNQNRIYKPEIAVVMFCVTSESVHLSLADLIAHHNANMTDRL